MKQWKREGGVALEVKDNSDLFYIFSKSGCPVPMTCQKNTKNLDLGLEKEAVGRKERMDTDHDG